MKSPADGYRRGKKKGMIVMKKIVSLLLIICMTIGVSSAVFAASPAPDHEWGIRLMDPLLVAGEIAPIEFIIPADEKKEISFSLIEMESPINEKGTKVGELKLFGTHLKEGYSFWEVGKITGSQQIFFGTFKIRVSVAGGHFIDSNSFVIEREAIRFIGKIGESGKAIYTFSDFQKGMAISKEYVLDVGPIPDLEGFYFPLRTICKIAGLSVFWDNQTKDIAVVKNTTAVIFKDGTLPVVKNRAMILELWKLNSLEISFIPYGKNIAIRRKG